MKGERVLHADDSNMVLQGVRHVLESFVDEEGHQIIGSATSAGEVQKLLEDGLKPTVALVDDKFITKGDGEAVAEIIKKFSLETIIVSLSTSEDVKWGKYNLSKEISGEELVKFLTNLQH